jgi:hypothetical protein
MRPCRTDSNVDTIPSSGYASKEQVFTALEKQVPTIANMTFPLELAVRTARDAAPATADDMGYVVKTIVGETYGRDAIKPWRIAEEGGGKVRIVGWIDADRGVPVPKPAFASEIQVGFVPYEAKKGDEVLLDLIVAPTQKIEMPGGRIREVDVAELDKDRGSLVVYADWLRRQLSKPDTGCLATGLPSFVETSRDRGLRKRADGVAKWIEFPRVHALQKVRVVNPRAFGRALVAGLGRQKAFGYGCMLPRELCDAVL